MDGPKKGLIHYLSFQNYKLFIVLNDQQHQIFFAGYFLSHFMPEESWTEHYEKHDLLRLDCSRYIWPKLSFIRKCATLSNFGQEKKLLIEKNKNKNFQLSDGNNMTSKKYVNYPHNKENVKNSKISGLSICETISEDFLFEKRRNSQERNDLRKQFSGEKRPRCSGQNVLYSDDEVQGDSSEDDDNGMSLFFRVCTQPLSVRAQ